MSEYIYICYNRYNVFVILCGVGYIGLEVIVVCLGLFGCF